MTPQQAAERFHEDGFLVLPGVFSAAEVESFSAETRRLERDVAPTLEAGDVFFEHEGGPVKSMFRVEQHSPMLDATMRDERLVKLMEAIYPDRGVAAFTLMYFGKAAGSGSPAPPHQDNAFSCLKPPLSLQASIALDPHTLANGAMHCLRGSHHLGLLPHRGSGVQGFSQTLCEDVDDARFPAVACLMQPGDLMLHHSETIHFSGANLSDQPRRMLSVVLKSPQAVRDEAMYERVQAERLRVHGRLADQ